MFIIVNVRSEWGVLQRLLDKKKAKGSGKIKKLR